MKDVLAQWYVINARDLREALGRVATGDDPDLVMVEIYANSASVRLETEEGSSLPEPPTTTQDQPEEGER